MPYQREWVSPEEIVVHNGLPVYRAYKDDDLEQPQSFWFVLGETALADEACDVRDLKEYNPNLSVSVALQKAIESGSLLQLARLKHKRHESLADAWLEALSRTE